MNSETILVCGPDHDSGLAEAVREANKNCIVLYRNDAVPPRPVRAPLTLSEKADRQTMMYQPCRCGSGKKYRFCCFRRG